MSFAGELARGWIVGRIVRRLRLRWSRRHGVPRPMADHVARAFTGGVAKWR